MDYTYSYGRGGSGRRGGNGGRGGGGGRRNDNGGWRKRKREDPAPVQDRQGGSNQRHNSPP